MKNLFWLLLLVIVLGGGFLAFPYLVPLLRPAAAVAPIATTTPQGATSTMVARDPKNATYTIEGVPVTLVDGSFAEPAAPGSASMIETEYFGNDVAYDFNNDGRMDTAFLLTQSTGGTGVFFYAVAAMNFPDGYHGSAGVRIGDRIAPQGTRINTEKGRVGVIEVTYADRAPGESFAVEPSVGKSLLVKFDPATMQFGVVEPDFTGEANPAVMKLDQKKWRWVRTNYTDGRVFVPKKEDAFSLTFTADGKVSGTTDCNGVSGSYTTTGSTLIFGAMATTLMYCDGSEEGVFNESLGQVSSYTFTSKGELELGLKASVGKMIFQ